MLGTHMPISINVISMNSKNAEAHNTEKGYLAGLVEKIKNSLAIKLFMLAAICLFLQIPIAFVDNLNSGRESRQREVVREITSKWGGNLGINGPIVCLSYYGDKTNYRGEREKSSKLYVPLSFNADASVLPEIRYRGIYQAVLFKADVSLSGEFDRIANVEQAQQSIFIGLSQLKGLKSAVGKITYFKKDGGGELGADLQFTATDSPKRGITAALPDGIDLSKPVKFSMTLKANGSQSIEIMPIGKNSSVTIDSPWAVSYTHLTLPTKLEV